MKKIFIKCLLTLFFAFCFLSTNFAQQKNLVMIHGLGGGARSLAPYANEFLRTRSSVGQAPTFEHNSADGVSTAAENSRNLTIGLSQGRTDRSMDIGIGHSMGGLTVREMDRQAILSNQQKMFGGFVMLGSPNHGTKLVTSFNDGSLDAFLNGFCKEVVLDPLLSLTTGALNLFGLSTAANITGLVKTFDSKICGWGVKLAEKGFKGFQTPSIKDLAQNAPFLDGSNGINGFTSATHKVCFMGNENSPVHWRLFSSNSNTPNDGLLHDGTQDQILVDDMNDIKNIELMTGIGFSMMSFACLFDPHAWYLVVPLGKIGYEFIDGYVWLDQSESQYNNLLGAFGSFTEQQTFLVFNCYGERGSLESQYQRGQISMNEYFRRVSALYSNPNCTQEITAAVQVPLNGESDGVVPLQSQRLVGSTNFILDGVNHFELRDHPLVTAQFTKLFNGQLDFKGNFNAQNFFITP
jgi:hypothetical protein